MDSGSAKMNYSAVKLRSIPKESSFRAVHPPANGGRYSGSKIKNIGKIRIIGFCHRARVGKDTAGSYLVANYGFKRISFADFLKKEIDQVLSVFGQRYQEKNKDQLRPMLIAWGQYRREQNHDHWLSQVEKAVNSEPDIKFVVTDVRYPNEADWIKSQKGLVIRIKRDTGLNIPSEAIMDKYRVDFTIDNNKTIEELYRSIDRIAERAGIVKSMNERYLPTKTLTDTHLKWIGIDFDSTIARKVWPQEGIGEPLPGVKEALDKLQDKGYKVVIYTSRHWGDITAIENWLEDHQIKINRIECGKVLLKLYIGDEAVRFTGWKEDIVEIEKILNSNKKA